MKNKVISFPHLGDYCYFIKPFLEEVTNEKVVLAPPITKKTVELGSKYSPDFICFPFKYNLGNYIEVLDEGANILFQFGGGCRYGNYGPLQEKILKDLGYNFEFYELIKNGKTSFNHTFKTFKNINPTLTKRKLIKEFLLIFIKIMLFDHLEHRARKKVPVQIDNFKKLKYKFINELKEQKNILYILKTYYIYKRKYRKVRCKKPKLKIGLIGELYTSMEPFSTFNLEEELKKYDISIKRYTTVSYLLIYKAIFKKFIKLKIKDYVNYHLGADATYNVYRVLRLKQKGYDGIIHTKPFGCTPEVGVMPILSKISNEKNIPIMFLSFDTETEDTGIKTRIEAFIDMLTMRKEKEHERKRKSLFRN